MSATTYQFLPQPTIIAGIPTTFAVTPNGSSSSQCVLALESGNSITEGGPVGLVEHQINFLTATFPTSGYYTVYTNSFSPALIDPYNSSNPLLVMVQADPLSLASQPNTVIGSASAIDAQGNPQSGINYTFTLIAEPSGSVYGASPAVFTGQTGSGGVLNEQFIIGCDYFGQHLR